MNASVDGSVRSTNATQSRRRVVMAVSMLWLAMGICTNAHAVRCPGQTADSTSCTVTPASASTDGEFEAVADTLRPGDELQVGGGTYTYGGRFAIGASGTQDKPVVIRAVDGETPLFARASGDYSQNNIEIENASYLTIRGLHFQGGDSGVRFIGGDHITFEDNEIFDTGNNALTANSADTDSFVIRRNHIHDTGKYTAGDTEGEGMYLGCNDNTCRMTNSVIENNYIHHTRGTSAGGNDGIELKTGSYGNVIRDNVIHDTNIGLQYPCIFVYGGGNAVNVVEGNVMWNCGEAVQVVSDAIVRNNIILNSSVGITAAPQAQVATMKNVAIVNNTIYGHDECLYIRWGSASNMVLANNAVYCSGTTAVNAAGLSGATIAVKSNYIDGSGTSVDGLMFLAGGNASSAFVNPAMADFWPTGSSVLLGKADATYVPATDFNGTARTAPYDVGAYEIEDAATNPGWTVSDAPKTNTPTTGGGDASSGGDTTAGDSSGGNDSNSGTSADSLKGGGALDPILLTLIFLGAASLRRRTRTVRMAHGAR